MVSVVDICNIALQNLGANTISDLNEGSVEARECALRYDSVRRAVLAAHPWNFASKRVELARLEETPSFGFDTQFALPGDFVRMIATEDQLEYILFNPDFNGFLTISNTTQYAEADRYKLEIAENGQQVLLSDNEFKRILYVFDQKDTAQFAPLFVEMLAQALAAAIAFRITGNRSQAQEEEAKWQRMNAEAKQIDGQQGTYERTERSVFLSARNNYS